MPKFVRLLIIATIMLAIFLHPFAPIRVFAASTDIVISEVQTGGVGTGTAGQEFVELRNDSNATAVLDSWRLVYSSSTDGTQYIIAEINGEIPAEGFALFVSSSFIVSQNVTPDALFAYNGGLSATGGHIKLLDGDGMERDRLGWGSAQFAEMQAVASPPGGQSLQRTQTDSDNNFVDFIVASPEPQGGDLLPLSDPPDPEPVEYLPIIITELLPDPASPKLDSEDEFIELYNPNDEPVNLKNHVLQTGSNFQYSFVLPEFSIEPQKYLVLYSSETNLTLSNSSSQARIIDPNGTATFETETYEDVGEAETWALIDTQWFATNQPTPGAANKKSVLVVTPEKDSDQGLGPCPAGKFRNPATNRCKMIAAAASALKPCNPDQVRNPETNRCRKIETAAGLTPCAAGQFRNPATNRCKKAETASTLVPCRAGQERNAETNRCRKVAGVSTTNPLTSPASAANTKTSVSYPALMAVGAVALGYGLYEYRQEIKRRFMKLFSKSAP